MTLKIISIKKDDEIQACFSVVSQLRPHIKEKEFLNIICHQIENGYQIAAVVSEDCVVAVAGYHFRENLAWGKYLYVEDLVSEQKQRSTGLGHMLLNWLHGEARKNKCDQLHLDSGVQRKDAHRFYEREGMVFASHHYLSQL